MKTYLPAMFIRHVLLQGLVLCRPMTVKWQQFSQSNRHSTIGTQQTEYHEALTSSVNDKLGCDSTFNDDGTASLYSICRVPMVEWWLDREKLDGHQPPWYWRLVFDTTFCDLHFLGVTRQVWSKAAGFIFSYTFPLIWIEIWCGVERLEFENWYHFRLRFVESREVTAVLWCPNKETKKKKKAFQVGIHAEVYNWFGLNLVS